MGSLSRRKGQRGEREVAELLRAVWPGARRGIQPRGARADGVCDVEGTPFWIECKTGSRGTYEGALRQAIEETDGRVPVVVIRRDRCEPIVAMRLADWIELVGGLEKERPEIRDPEATAHDTNSPSLLGVGSAVNSLSAQENDRDRPLRK